MACLARETEARILLVVSLWARAREAHVHLQGRVALGALVQRHRVRREAALRPQLHARHARHEAQL